MQFGVHLDGRVVEDLEGARVTLGRRPGEAELGLAGLQHLPLDAPVARRRCSSFTSMWVCARMVSSAVRGGGPRSSSVRATRRSEGVGVAYLEGAPRARRGRRRARGLGWCAFSLEERTSSGRAACRR